MAVAVMPAGWLGWIQDQVTTKNGPSGAAVASNVVLPVSQIDPRNPDNYSYLATVNAAMGLVNKVQGKATPSFAIPGIPAKASWMTSAFLNQRIGGSNAYLDSTGFNTSEFAIGINNGDGAAAGSSLCRVYLGAHYSMIGISQMPVGGAINVALGGICLAGDQANTTLASGLGSVFAAFTAPTTDSGNAYNAASVVLTGVDDVFSWDLMLMRPHDYQIESDSTLNAARINAGQPGGTFSYVSTPKAASIISSTVTIVIGASGTGVSFLLYMNRDEPMQSVGPRRGTIRYTYTLGDFGAANSGNVGYPWLISAAP